MSNKNEVTEVKKEIYFDPELSENKHYVSNCFEQLGLNTLAKDVYTAANWSKLHEYARIAEMKARAAKNNSVIECLWALGLSHG